MTILGDKNRSIFQKIIYYFGALLPNIILYGIIIFIYLNYTQSYLFPMITGNYQYEFQNPPKIDIQAFNTMLDIEQHFFSFINMNYVDQQNAFKVQGNNNLVQQKQVLQDINQAKNSNGTSSITFNNIEIYKRTGWIYFIIIHIMLLLLLISIFRTIFTSPGLIPQEWHENTERQLTENFEKEKKNLLEQRKKMIQEMKLQKNIEQIQIQKQQILYSPDQKNTSQLANTGNEQKFDKSQQKYEKLDDKDNQNIEEIQLNYQDQKSNDQQEVHSKKQSFDLQQQNTSIVNIDDNNNYFQISDNDGNDDDENKIDPEFMRQISQIAIRTIIERDNQRFCSHCHNFKPPRTHHCKQCSKCILKMDHHCQWILNCVGYFNYKFFINMLEWAIILLMFLSITYTRCVRDNLFNQKIETLSLFMIILSYLFMITLLVVLIGFTGFHFWLILTGKTTLEYCEKKKDNQKGKYDQGLYQNWIAIFGKNPLLWFIPIGINDPSQGLIFEEKSTQ